MREKVPHWVFCALLAACCLLMLGMAGILIPGFWSRELSQKNGSLDRRMPAAEQPPTEYEFVSEIPVLVISAADRSVLFPQWPDLENLTPLPPREETTAALYVFDRAENRLTDNPTQVFPAAGMKLRGRTSSYAQLKKPIALELRDAEGLPQDQPFFGLAAESDFVLHAPYIDRSLIRNYLAYSLGAELFEYSPAAVFAEVFLNEEGTPCEESDYAGVYLLTEKIKNSKTRVNVGKFVQAKNPERQFEKGGGYIIKRDAFEPGYDTALRMAPTTQGREYSIVSPKRENMTDDTEKTMEKEIRFFEDVLYHGTEEELERCFDLESFADLMLLNEYLKNQEGYSSSTYFYRKVGGKLMAGPPWDFDIGMGNVDYTPGLENAEGFWVLGQEYAQVFLRHPVFAQLLKSRWQELRAEGGAFHEGKIDETITQLNEYLGAAAARNDAAYPDLWVQPPFSNAPDYQISSSLEDREMIREFLRRRGDWLDRNINAL